MWSNVVEETGDPVENHRTWMDAKNPVTCPDKDIIKIFPIQIHGRHKLTLS